MQVVNEIDGTLIPISNSRLVVVNHLSEQIIFGYVPRNAKIRKILIYTDGGFLEYSACMDFVKDFLVFSNFKGRYFSKVNVPEEVLLRETLIKGNGNFPYSIERRYEACESFNIFEGAQKVIDPNKEYILSHFLNFTFGLEFETSQGYVPEDICFRDGLIPLRDGSISGIEYSTVVLSRNEGLALLEQQVESLKKYTDFNKDCSIHIHF